MSDPEKKKPCDNGPEEHDFPIRDFPDLRKLRHTFLRCGDKPINIDSSDNPRPDEQEQDFGLKRSTAEEALELLREAEKLEEELADDPLAEFLDDDS